MRWKSILVSLLFLATIVVWMASGNVGSEAVREAALAREEATSQSSSEPEPFLVQIKSSLAEPYLRKIKIIGRTQAIRRSEIKSETSAVVEEVFVNEGQTVTKGDMIVRLSVDTREASLNAARAGLARSKKNYEAVKDLQQGGYQSDIELLSAQEALSQNQQQLAQAEKALEDTKIVAPYSGVLEELIIQEGELVSLAQSVAKLIDLDPLEAVIYVSEQELNQVNLGQKATINLVNGSVAEGEVSFISPSSDQSTGTFEVRVALDNPDMRLREGLSGNVAITVEPIMAHFQSKNVLTLDDLGRIGVKGIVEGNTVEFYPVSILDDNDQGVFLSGLPEKLEIIVQGQDYVISGEQVRLSENTQ